MYDSQTMGCQLFISMDEKAQRTPATERPPVTSGCRAMYPESS